MGEAAELTREFIFKVVLCYDLFESGVSVGRRSHVLE